MECKAGLYTGISADTAVLIETLWNVKPHSTSVGWIFLSEVLIETLWNVKIRQGVLLRISGISINRNIVECKEKYTKTQVAILLGINRNIVECKVCTGQTLQLKMVGINRNIVECKGK